MSAVVNVISVRNSGVRATGLAPAWVMFKRLSDNADITPPPVVSEVGLGLYKFSYDPDGPNGEAVGQLDAGAIIAAHGERFVDVILTADQSRINNMPAQTVDRLLATAVPNANSPGTVADALCAARAQGFGRWQLVGTTLTLYGADNTTPVRTFTLNSAVAPTSRG